MDSDAHAQLERIKKYSRSLQRLMQFFLIVMAIAGIGTAVVLLSWSAPPRPDPTVTRFLSLNGLVFEWSAAPIAAKALGALYLAAIYVVVFMIAQRMTRLFGLYAAGRIFTAEHVREIRTIGILLIACSLTWILTLPIPLMLNVPADEASGSIAAGPTMSVRTDNLSPFFCGLIVIFVSWVMDVGRRLREENDLVV
jgi:hypothetical protein